jgi:hypothetical protein
MATGLPQSDQYWSVIRAEVAVRLLASCIVAIGLLTTAHALACRPSPLGTVTPREVTFVETVREAHAVIRGRIVAKGASNEFDEPNTYVDIDVQEVLAGSISGPRLRLWGHRGEADTCGVVDALQKIEADSDVVIALWPHSPPARHAKLGRERIFVAGNHGVVRPGLSEVQLRGYRYSRACPRGCEFSEAMRLDELRAKLKREAR